MNYYPEIKLGVVVTKAFSLMKSKTTLSSTLTKTLGSGMLPQLPPLTIPTWKYCLSIELKMTRGLPESPPQLIPDIPPS